MFTINDLRKAAASIQGLPEETVAAWWRLGNVVQGLAHLNKSQRELAADSGVSQSMISRSTSVRSFFETTWTSDKRYMESAPYFHQRHATESRCMRAADYVVTLSGPMRDEIVEQHAVPADKVAGIPNAVDVDRFSPQTRDDALRASLGLTDAQVLGYVSNLSHPREGQEAMIAAVPKIRAAGINAKVLLVGDGARRPELEALAKRLGVTEHVVFAGSVPFDRVAAYYAQIDLFVVPRTNERAGRLVSPMKPFEAMAMGIPLLVSDLPALVEIVADDAEPRGFFYTAEDAADLARVAVACLQDPTELDRRASNAACSSEYATRPSGCVVNARGSPTGATSSLPTSRPNDVGRRCDCDS